MELLTLLVTRFWRNRHKPSCICIPIMKATKSRIYLIRSLIESNLAKIENNFSIFDAYVSLSRRRRYQFAATLISCIKSQWLLLYFLCLYYYLFIFMSFKQIRIDLKLIFFIEMISRKPAIALFGKSKNNLYIIYDFRHYLYIENYQRFR